MTPPKPKHTLLIIDDDEIFCDTTKDAFQSERFKVLTGETGTGKNVGQKCCLSFNYTQSARARGISLSTLKRKVKQFRLKKEDNYEKNTDR